MKIEMKTISQAQWLEYKTERKIPSFYSVCCDISGMVLNRGIIFNDSDETFNELFTPLSVHISLDDLRHEALRNSVSRL